MADKVKTEVLEKSAEISEEQKNEEILREFSKEDNVRRLNRPTELLVNTLAFLLSVFLIYTSAFGTLPALQQRSVYLTFVMAMLFLVYPASSKKAGKKVAWYDYIFSILAAVACIYVVVEYMLRPKLLCAARSAQWRTATSSATTSRRSSSALNCPTMSCRTEWRAPN